MVCIFATGFRVLGKESQETSDESQPFRVDVNLVTLRFTVTDVAGRFKNSLSLEDLIVEEDGVPVEQLFHHRSV